MSEIKYKTQLVRKQEYGGTCGVCGSKVILLTDGEPWKLSCDCKIIDVPVWVQHDAYSRRQYRRHFELEMVIDGQKPA